MGSVFWTLFASTLAVAHVFDLSELQWTLKNQNGSIVVPGSLPSQAHLDLFEAGIIDDPLLGINGVLCNVSINYSIVHSSQSSQKDGSSTTTGLTPRT